MPRIYDKLKAMHAANKVMPVDFDPAQPWSGVFQHALECEDRWWNEHRTDPCRGCRWGHAKVGDYVDGDVMTGGAASSTTTGTDTMTPMMPVIVDPNGSLKRGAPGVPVGPPRPKRPRGRGGGQQYETHALQGVGDISHHDGTKWVLSKWGVKFCEGYSDGTCFQVCADGLHCKFDPQKGTSMQSL